MSRVVILPSVYRRVCVCARSIGRGPGAWGWCDCEHDVCHIGDRMLDRMPAVRVSSVDVFCDCVPSAWPSARLRPVLPQQSATASSVYAEIKIKVRCPGATRIHMCAYQLSLHGRSAACTVQYSNRPQEPHRTYPHPSPARRGWPLACQMVSPSHLECASFSCIVLLNCVSSSSDHPLTALSPRLLVERRSALCACPSRPSVRCVCLCRSTTTYYYYCCKKVSS